MKTIETGKIIRFAAKVNYLGNVGSNSVLGYWTIWQTRKTVDGWSQPYPVHVNFSDNDIVNYRGELYNWYEHEQEGDGLQPVRPIICPRCNEMRLSPATHSAICWKCNMYGGGE